jgi:hypothetical protein
MYLYLYLNNKKACDKYINNRKYKLGLLLKSLKVIIMAGIVKKDISNIKKNTGDKKKDTGDEKKDADNEKKDTGIPKKKANIKKGIDIAKKVISTVVIKVSSKCTSISNSKRDSK